MTDEKLIQILTDFTYLNGYTLAQKAFELTNQHRPLNKACITYMVSRTQVGQPSCNDFVRGVVLTLMILEELKIEKECQDLERLVRTEDE